MAHPKVSVIIPTFGNQPKLKRAIESVINQSISEDIELIIIDDNGKDSQFKNTTNKLIDELDLNKLHNYKVIYHEKNMERSVARNTGIAEAKGRYIAFLDNDDYFNPRKMEVQYLAMESAGEEYAISYTNSDRISRGKLVSKSSNHIQGNQLINTLSRNIYIHPGSNMLIRKKVLDKYRIRFNIKISYNEDLLFLAAILEKYKLLHVDYDGLVVDVSPDRKDVEKLDIVEVTKIYREATRNITRGLTLEEQIIISTHLNLQLFRFHCINIDIKKIITLVKNKDLKTKDILSYSHYLFTRKITKEHYSFDL